MGDAEDMTIHGPYENAFEALGLPDADQRMAKSMLRIALREHMAANKVTQAELAALMGVPQSNVSRLLGSETTGTSFDQLFRAWAVLGGGVQVSVLPATVAPKAGVQLEAPGMLLPVVVRPPAERPGASGVPVVKKFVRATVKAPMEQATTTRETRKRVQKVITGKTITMPLVDKGDLGIVAVNKSFGPQADRGHSGGARQTPRGQAIQGQTEGAKPKRKPARSR